MGFFSFTKKIAAKVSGSVIRVVPKPLRPIATKIQAKALSKYTPTGAVEVAITAATAYAGFGGLSASVTPTAAAFSNFLPTTKPTGGKSMALNLGNILNTVGGILGKTNTTSNPYIGGLSGALSLASAFVPARATPAPRAPVPMSPRQQRAAGVGTAVATRGLTQEIFNAGNKVLARLGISYSVTASGFTSALRRSLGSIASLARRTPAGTIVSILAGLGLTALEANMLAAWYAQRKKGRRMNPANARALRRAARRIRGFHKLCTHTDLLKSRSKRSGSCGSCKKNPCRC